MSGGTEEIEFIFIRKRGIVRLIRLFSRRQKKRFLLYFLATYISVFNVSRFR